MTSSSRPGAGAWAIEIKRSLVPTIERGFHLACEDLKPARRLVAIPGEDRYRLRPDVEAIGARTLAEDLARL